MAAETAALSRCASGEPDAAVGSLVERIEAVKRWLVVKTRLLFGTDEIQRRLEEQYILLERLARRMNALERLSIEPASRGAADGNGQNASIRCLARRGLFVVGCARSGTSVVTQALNSSPDLLLLAESNFYLNFRESDFAAFFAGIHVAFNNSRTKGTYIPPGLGDGCGALALLVRLCRDYRYVGEKVALGPGDFWSQARSAYVDFQAEHFLQSRHLLLVRSPVDVVLSLRRMFPQESLRSLAECWLRAVETCVDLYRVCQNCRWLFFDDLDAELVERAVSDLDISLEIPAGLFDAELVTTRSGGLLPPLLAPHKELLDACGAVYHRLKEGICPSRLVCQASDGGWRFFDDILDHCRQARGKLPA